MNKFISKKKHSNLLYTINMVSS